MNEKMKAGKILALLGAEPLNLQTARADDIERISRFEKIEGRINYPTVRVLDGSDPMDDYLVTMFDICLNWHDRISLYDMYKGFVKRSEQRRASWVRDVPNWEEALKAPFEYVLRGVLNRTGKPWTQMARAKESFLIEDIMRATESGRSPGSTYASVLKPFWITPNRNGIDPLFDKMMAAAHEERLYRLIQRTEGDMVNIHQPQYTLGW